MLIKLINQILLLLIQILYKLSLSLEVYYIYNKNNRVLVDF